MSEDKSKGLGSSEVEGAASGNSAAGAPNPKIVEIHGKKFDISTPEGLLQAQAVYDVMTTIIGRQGNELGGLRKFVKEVSPQAEEVDVIKAAKAKASEGDFDSAVDAIFAYSKAEKAKLENKLKAEKHNSKTWDAYLDSRKDLVDVFGRSSVREISEALAEKGSLELYDADDPFKVLDSYWLPKVKRDKPPEVVSDTPPVTLSGGAPQTHVASGSSKQEDKGGDDLSLDSLLDVNSSRRYR